MTTGADVQATWVATLVDEWARAGVTDAVVAPGSRSTPLLDALAADGRIRLHVVLDERSAGFVALGLGLATGRPAPVVTTSGTAAVELHPAVVEAHQAGVPLLVVTADRPPELHQVGAPQTVDQGGLYGGAVRLAVDPGVADEAARNTWRSVAARVVADTVGHPSGPGPVHLNLPLREPLLGTAGPLPPARGDRAPWHHVAAAAGGVSAGGVSAATVELLAGAAGRPGLIVAGGAGPDPDALLALAERLDWPVLADPRSCARRPHPLVVASADSLLRVPALAACHPEVVVRFGRPWASKVLSQWLAGLGPATIQVMVDPYGGWVEPERAAAVVDRSEPTALCRAVLDALGPAPAPSAASGVPAGSGAWAGSGAPAASGVPAASGGPAAPGGPAGSGAWAGGWVRAEAAAQGAIDRQLAAEDGPTEAGVARTVAAAVPAGGTLLTSSSMPVRDVEWWSRPRAGLRVVANRGANGIDGVVSTAVGVALGASPAPVVALLGDLAFLYDAGALLGATGRDLCLTLVVVDNHGGGIFSFLPQATALPPERFERLWATPHDVDLAALAGAYGVAARRLETLDELAAACAEPAPGVTVLIVATDRAANVAAHDRLNAAVAAAVGSAGAPPTPGNEATAGAAPAAFDGPGAPPRTRSAG